MNIEEEKSSSNSSGEGPINLDKAKNRIEDQALEIEESQTGQDLANPGRNSDVSLQDQYFSRFSHKAGYGEACFICLALALIPVSQNHSKHQKTPNFTPHQNSSQIQFFCPFYGSKI